MQQAEALQAVHRSTCTASSLLEAAASRQRAGELTLVYAAGDQEATTSRSHTGTRGTGPYSEAAGSRLGHNRQRLSAHQDLVPELGRQRQ